MASHGVRSAYRRADPIIPILAAVVPAYGAPYLAVPRGLPRPTVAVDSEEGPAVANLAWANLVSAHHGAVADDHGSDHARAIADEMAVGADCRGAAVVAGFAASTGYAGVLDCRLWDWHDCCDQKSCPSLRDPWTVGNARPCSFYDS